MNVVMNEEHLDHEWMELIKEAKNLGLTREEIRLFLKSYQEQSVFS